MTASDATLGSENWILAFDASCGTCREISRTVAAACDGRLVVLPLTHPAVAAWRESALGARAPWEPTLIRARGDEALRVWVGQRIALPLVRRLGMRSTVRVLNELGRLRREVHEPMARTGGVSRKNFLRIGAGAAMAGGMLVLGRTPALAEQRYSAATAWVNANKDRLPRTYSEITKYSVEYRRAIYDALPPSTRSTLWREHLRRYRAAHPELTEEQETALSRLEEYASLESTFTAPRTEGSAARRTDERIHAALVGAFGAREAYAIAASLGPDEGSGPGEAGALAPACSCSTASDYCSGTSYCRAVSGQCHIQTSGCGALWQYRCNGLCHV